MLWTWGKSQRLSYLTIHLPIATEGYDRHFACLLLFLDDLYTNNVLQGCPVKLFSLVGDILTDSYPPTAATIDGCSLLLALLSNILGRGSTTRRLSLLTIVKDALVPWFADRHRILAEDRYNDMVSNNA